MSSPRSIAARIDEIADRFELAWQSGSSPRVEDYLGATPEPERSSLLRELVALELELRTRRGEVPGIDEYCQRFPQYGELVQSLFAEPSHQPPRQPFAAEVPSTPSMQGELNASTITEPHGQPARSDAGVPSSEPASIASNPQQLVGKGVAFATPSPLSR